MHRRMTAFALLALLTLALGYLAGCASSGQPHMTAALDELRAARQELEAAVTDKGGHRSRAIAFVDDAITEVRAGIDYARTH
jgi:outer membrane murein-binding lipoprotein Lpp